MKDRAAIKASTISHCGNWGFIGSTLGNIDMFNMQSGIHKRTFTGHTKPITSLATDNLVRTLITSSLDGDMHFWDIQSGNLKETINFGSPICGFVFHSESGLIACYSDDLYVRVIDIETFKIVREFCGHSNRITDLVNSITLITIIIFSALVQIADGL